MRINRRTVGLLAASLGLVVFVACVGDEAPNSVASEDAGADASKPDSSVADGATDASATDGGSLDAGPTPTGNLVWATSASVGGGTSYAPGGSVMAVGGPNLLGGIFGAQTVGSIEGKSWPDAGNEWSVAFRMDDDKNVSLVESLQPTNVGAVGVDSNGDIYACGNYLSENGAVVYKINGTTVTFNQAGEPNDLLVKIQGSTGAILWAVSLTGNATMGSFCDAIAVSGTNVVVSYYFQGSISYQLKGVGTPVTASTTSASGDYDSLVAAIDPTSGEALWAKQFSGSATDYVTALAFDSASNVYVGGATASPTLSVAGTPQLTNTAGNAPFIVELAAAGSHAVGFKQAFATSGAAADSGSIHGLGVAPNGDVVACGGFQSGNGGAGGINFGKGIVQSNGEGDGFIVRVDNNNNTKWVDTFGGAEPDSCVALAIDPTDQVIAGLLYGSSNVKLGGHTFDNPVGVEAAGIAKLSSTGTTLWGYDVVGANATLSSVSLLPVGDAGLNDVVYAGAFTGAADLGSGALADAGSGFAFFAVRRAY